MLLELQGGMDAFWGTAVDAGFARRLVPLIILSAYHWTPHRGDADLKPAYILLDPLLCAPSSQSFEMRLARSTKRWLQIVEKNVVFLEAEDVRRWTQRVHFWDPHRAS